MRFFYCQRKVLRKFCTVKVKAITFIKRLLPGLLIVTIAIFVVGFASVKSNSSVTSQPLLMSQSANISGAGENQILPDTPLVFSPDNNLVVNGQSVMFSWHSTGDENKYELMYSWNSDFSSAETVFIDDTVYSLSFDQIPTEPLFWKMRSVTAAQVYSPWTSEHKLIFKPLVSTWVCEGNCETCSSPCGRRIPVQ